jgi:LAO/AO transport system kinase
LPRSGGEPTPEALAERVRRGDRRAIARTISLIESGSRVGALTLRQLYPVMGGTHVVGLTGPPGAGKSTLAGQLGLEARKLGRSVAVLALDPSSPFTGGALLGDRIRMQELASDPGAYVRSMAGRGARGGLALAARDAVHVLEAAGFGLVLVETIGAGQSELDVAELAHTTVVVAVPELGDEIQALKAGLYEAADVFALNKSDLPGADQAAAALELSVERGSGDWRPPIVRCSATAGAGVADLLRAIDDHWVHLASDDRLREKLKSLARAEVVDALRDSLLDLVLGRVGHEQLDLATARVARGEVDARSAARDIVELAFTPGESSAPSIRTSVEGFGVLE